MSNDELQKAIDDITNEGMVNAAPQDTGVAVELPEEMISGNKNPMPVVGAAPVIETPQPTGEGMNIEVQQAEPEVPDLSNNPFASAPAPEANAASEGLPTLGEIPAAPEMPTNISVEAPAEGILPEAPAPAPETTTAGGVEVPVNIPVETEATGEGILPEAPVVPMEEVNAPESAPEAPEAPEMPEVVTTAVPENEAANEAPEAVEAPEVPETLEVAGETDDVDVEQINSEAMSELYPLLDVMNGYPEKKFEIALSIAKKGDKKALKTAFEAAKAISDSTVKGESLMKIIEAIEEM